MMASQHRHLLVDIQDLSKAFEYQIDITRTSLVRESLRMEEWSHIKIAVRIFNTILQQQSGPRPSKKAFVADLKRQADECNAAAKVKEVVRIVFQVDHTKKLLGRDHLQIYCQVRPMASHMRMAGTNQGISLNQEQSTPLPQPDSQGEISAAGLYRPNRPPPNPIENQFVNSRFPPIQQVSLGPESQLGEDGYMETPPPPPHHYASTAGGPSQLGEDGYMETPPPPLHQYTSTVGGPSQLGEDGYMETPPPPLHQYTSTAGGSDGEGEDGYMVTQGEYPLTLHNPAPATEEEELDGYHDPLAIAASNQPLQQHRQQQVSMPDMTHRGQQQDMRRVTGMLSKGQSAAELSWQQQPPPRPPHQTQSASSPNMPLQSSLSQYGMQAPQHIQAHGPASPRWEAPLPQAMPPQAPTAEEPPKPKPRPRPPFVQSQSANSIPAATALAAGMSAMHVNNQPQSQMQESVSMASIPTQGGRTSGSIEAHHQPVTRGESFKSLRSQASTDSQAGRGVVMETPWRSVYFDSDRIEDCRFYHRFDDQDREAIRAQIDDLMRDRNDGDWLLRSRVTANQDNEYVLVVSFRGRTLHIPMQHNRKSNLYSIHDVEFESIQDLINYYHNNFLSRQIRIKLNEPVETVMEVDGYCYMPPM